MKYKVKFLKDDSRGSFRAGDIAKMHPSQAIHLADRQIVKILSPALPKSREAYVRARLETFDEAKLHTKLAGLDVKAKQSASKAELIDAYLRAVGIENKGGK